MFHRKLLLFVLFLFILSSSPLYIHAQKFQSDSEEWSVEIKYIEPGTINLYSTTSEDSKVMGHFYYLDKILILKDKNEYVKFGWVKVVYPKEGYVLEKDLLSTDEKLALDKKFKNNPNEFASSQNWQPKIIQCDKDFTFIKKGNDFSEDNIGIIKEDDEVLSISSDGVQNKEWIKIIYPQRGFVYSKNLALIPSENMFGLGISYGALNIPYEKNLTNYKNPIGGFLEYTKSNWDFLFRLGYTNGQSNLKEYILKNEIFYLHVQYSFLRIINNHIRFYALAGGGYWHSKFQFTKYPSLTDYFPEESQTGLGYSVGGGIEYTLAGFFLGVQYSFFGTEEATFGPEPKEGDFTNQYKLFIGSNQIEIDFGYRFKF